MSQHRTYRGTIYNTSGTTSSWTATSTSLDQAYPSATSLSTGVPSTISSSIASSSTEISTSTSATTDPRGKRYARRNDNPTPNTPSTTIEAWVASYSSVWTLGHDESPGTSSRELIVSSEFIEDPHQSYSSTIGGIWPIFVVEGTFYFAYEPITLTLVGLTSSSTTSGLSNTADASTEAASGTPTSTSASSGIATNGPPSVSKTHSSGVSIGAVVGCLLAGLLIASAVGLWLFQRRKRGKTPRGALKREMNGSEFVRNSLKLGTGTRSDRPKHAPQPESDQTIARLANRTLDDIELFVETYYTDRAMNHAGRAVTCDVSTFDSPHLSHPLVDMFQASDSATVLLKHCITYFLMRKIDPTIKESLSLLPKEFVVPSNSTGSALSQARVLKAQSLPNPEQNEKRLEQRERTAQTIFQQMELAFQPWVQGTVEDRAKTFKGVVAHLSEFGTVLFAQPATFEWRWVAGRPRGHNEIVMLPGLDKKTDSQAVSLAKPICLIEKVSNFLCGQGDDSG